MLEIVSAKWGIDPNWADVTQRVRILWYWGNAFFATSEQLGVEPDANARKRLVVSLKPDRFSPTCCEQGVLASAVLDVVQRTALDYPESAQEAYSNVASLCSDYPHLVKRAHWKADGYAMDKDGGFIGWRPEPSSQDELDQWRRDNQYSPGRSFLYIQLALNALMKLRPTDVSLLLPICTELREWMEIGYHTFVIEPRPFHRLHSPDELAAWSDAGYKLLKKLGLLAATFAQAANVQANTPRANSAPLSPPTRKDRVVADAIEKAIRLAGCRLAESDIIEKSGYSRSAVRKQLKRLVEAKRIIHHGKRGGYSLAEEK